MFKTWQENLREFERAHGFFFSALLLLALILVKNPFSRDSFISNLYPYADSIHYINPARSFLAGEGLKIMRKGKGFPPNVPPLYSLLLVPFLALHDDPRIFYIVNIILSLVSLTIFYIISRKIIEDRWVRSFLLLLFVTNPILQWYPMLVMAENLILPLFLIGIYLLIEKVSLKKAFFAGIISISFYATKYANAPLTVVFSILYIINILLAKIKNKDKLKTLTVFILGFLIASIPFEIYELTARNRSTFKSLEKYFFSLFLFGSEKEANALGTSIRFSKYYFWTHLIRYLKAILGFPSEFWGQEITVILRPFALFAWIGLIWGILCNKQRYLSLSLVTMLTASILFISSFYVFHLRYIYFIIPMLFIGVGVFADLIHSWFKRRSMGKYFYLSLAGLLIVYLSQAKIYLYFDKLSSPHDYFAVLSLNEYFGNSLSSVQIDKKPIVISSLPSYFIDFYSNNKYDLLPLSYSQSFFGNAEIAWGENDYANLIALYQSYLDEGYALYVQPSSYVWNMDKFFLDYIQISRSFNLVKVYQGCNHRCNLYLIKGR